MTARSVLQVEAEVEAADQPERVAEERAAFSEVIILRLRKPAVCRHFRNSCQLVSRATCSWACRKRSNCSSRRSALTLPGLEILAAQDVVDVLQPGPAEGEGTPTRSSWSGLGSMNGFRRTRADDRRVDRAAAELLELTAALLPVHRHQGEDEVRLVELHALGVDADEDLGDLLLVGRRAELDHLEAEVAQSWTRSMRSSSRSSSVVATGSSSRPRRAGEELADGRLVALGPERRDVGDELGVASRSRRR